MRRSEIVLRKELAVTHLRIARAELALSRARRSSRSLATANHAVELASSLLAQTTAGRSGGRWKVYARAALRVVQIVLGLQRVLS